MPLASQSALLSKVSRTFSSRCPSSPWPRRMSAPACAPCTSSFLQLPQNTDIVIIESSEQLKSSRCSLNTLLSGWVPAVLCSDPTCLQFPCRDGICMRHRCRMGAWVGNCLSYTLAVGIYFEEAAAGTRQHCFAAGEVLAAASPIQTINWPSREFHLAFAPHAGSYVSASGSCQGLPSVFAAQCFDPKGTALLCVTHML